MPFKMNKQHTHHPKAHPPSSGPKILQNKSLASKTGVGGWGGPCFGAVYCFSIIGMMIHLIVTWGVFLCFYWCLCVFDGHWSSWWSSSLSHGVGVDVYPAWWSPSSSHDLHHRGDVSCLIIIFTCGGFAPWWWWAASWGCGWTGGREARSNQLINTSSSYHQLIIIQSSLSHHHLVVGGHQEGRQGQPLTPSFLCHHVNALMLSNVSIVQFWRVVCHQCNGIRKFHVVIRWIDLNKADGYGYGYVSNSGLSWNTISNAIRCLESPPTQPIFPSIAISVENITFVDSLAIESHFLLPSLFSTN